MNVSFRAAEPLTATERHAAADLARTYGVRLQGAVGRPRDFRVVGGPIRIARFLSAFRNL